MRPVLATLGLSCALVLPSSAQNPDTTRSGSDSTLRVFFDCPQFQSGCDFDFMRTEITFVNWVRNREDADVHVLVTTQGTGGGGTEYTLTFLGLRRFTGQADTLRTFTAPNDTEDSKRKSVARTLKLGLVRFVASTPSGPRLEISYQAPHAQTVPVRDPWKNWVFSIETNTNLNGEKRQRFAFTFSSLSASRITQVWKWTTSISWNYSESRFLDVPVFDTLGNQIGSQTVRSISRGYNGNQLVARALSAHWTLGGTVRARMSTFSNYDLYLDVAPGVEYDFYPYAQSTRRLITLRYTVGPRYFVYRDTTIFDRTTETRLHHNLNLSIDVTQPWGSTFLSFDASNYLYDFHKNSLTVFGSLSVRLFRGFSFRLSGNYERLHDQLNLPKAGASDTQILLQRRELATNYRYFTFFTLSYSFGSTNNNIVNPRYGRDRTFFF
jgi:hypothetical protein